MAEELGLVQARSEVNKTLEANMREDAIDDDNVHGQDKEKVLLIFVFTLLSLQLVTIARSAF